MRKKNNLHNEKNRKLFEYWEKSCSMHFGGPVPCPSQPFGV